MSKTKDNDIFVRGAPITITLNSRSSDSLTQPGTVQ
jgi:hypothetical protein